MASNPTGNSTPTHPAGAGSALMERIGATAGSRIVGYLPGAYPTEHAFKDALDGLYDAGIRVLEIGIPGAIGDLEGGTIARALEAVEDRGLDPLDVIVSSTSAARERGFIPVVMAFRAAVFDRVGIERFVDAAAEHGATAILVPDATAEEFRLLRGHCARHDLAVVPFVPAVGDTPPIEQDAAFVYLQTADVPTGTAFEPDTYLAERVRQVRAVAPENVPVALGFGIRTPEQVRRARALGADLVIVGTGMVDALNRGIDALRDYALDVAAAVTSANARED